MTDLLAVAHASDIAALGEPDITADHVREVLTAPNFDPARDSWVAVDPDGVVAGWSFLRNPHRAEREFVEAFVHPERGRPVQAPLLARQLARVAQRAAERGVARLTARCGAIPTERHWIGVLRDAGFDFVKRYARMRRPLTGLDIAAPAPPRGVRIRPVRPGDDEDLRTFHRILDTAFRDTPDHIPTTYEQWRAQVAALPTVPWDHWYVAEADGVPIGALQSSDSASEQREGRVRNLAVLREHRRRGIGAALLWQAFAGYAARGYVSVGLGVDLANPTEAARLYRSVGMTPFYEADIFERDVPAAPVPGRAAAQGETRASDEAPALNETPAPNEAPAPGQAEAVRVGRARSAAT